MPANAPPLPNRTYHSALFRIGLIFSSRSGIDTFSASRSSPHWLQSRSLGRTSGIMAFTVSRTFPRLRKFIEGWSLYPGSSRTPRPEASDLNRTSLVLSTLLYCLGDVTDVMATTALTNALFKIACLRQRRHTPFPSQRAELFKFWER